MKKSILVSFLILAITTTAFGAQAIYPRVQPETAAYFAFAASSTTPAVVTQFTINEYIKAVKFSAGVVFNLARILLDLSSSGFITQSSVDFRPFAMSTGWKFSIKDSGNRTSTAYGNGVILGGETLSDELVTSFTNSSPSYNTLESSGNTITHAIESTGNGAFALGNTFASDNYQYGLYKGVWSGTIWNSGDATYKPNFYIRSVAAGTNDVFTGSTGALTGTFYATTVKASTSGYAAGVYIFTGGKLADFEAMTVSVKRIRTPTDSGILLTNPNVAASFVFNSTSVPTTHTITITRN